MVEIYVTLSVALCVNYASQFVTWCVTQCVIQCVIQYWEFPTFNKFNSGGSSRERGHLSGPPLLGFVKVGNFQHFLTRSFLVRFDFFTAFLEMSKRALSFWKHSRPHFTMTNGPKRPQKLAAAPSVAVPLYNSETTFFLLNGHCYCIVLNLSVVGVNRKVSKRLKHEKN